MIYRKDLADILKNWAALIIVLTLILLPSLYALFNIKASWDPYGHTRGIKVAVSNEDRGASIKGQRVNAGAEIITSLKENKKLGWVFTNKEEAQQGVRSGKYYASIAIPKDLSAKLASVLSENPEKPVITYTVNEKLNPVAPKITEKGAAGIVDQVNESFVKTANGAIFKLFNELGIELAKDLPSIEKLKKLVFDLENRMPEIKKTVSTAATDAEKAKSIVNKASAFLQEITVLSGKAADLSKALEEDLGISKEALQNLPSNIKRDAALLHSAAKSAEETALAPEDNTSSQQLKSIADRSSRGIQWINSTTSILNNLSELSDTNAFQPAIIQLQQMKQAFQDLNEASSSASYNKDMLLAAAKDATSKTEAFQKEAAGIEPYLKSEAERAGGKISDKFQKLSEAKDSLPKITAAVQNSSKKLDDGIAKLAEIQKALPEAEAKIHRLADKIRAFERKENLSDLVTLLRNDFRKESDFFAKPVLLKENRLYPIPNYGSGLAPFYTALSLWVGGLLLVSLLKVKAADGNHRSYQEYFGRLFTFCTIGLLQAAVVSAGNLLLLHIHAVHPFLFFLSALFASAVFMVIIYTLVSVFDNAGKAIAIVFLVLQIAGSGGTFPIQVTPPFFQFINPFLPFTYGISLLRESAGGILPESVWHDVRMLTGFGCIAIVFGVFLKKPINRVTAGFVKKAEQSRIIH
nr:YhgE/Pip domain-containing protein [Metabacillus kandeliae]